MQFEILHIKLRFVASVKDVNNLVIMDQYFRFHVKEGQILKRVPPFFFLNFNGLLSSITTVDQ